VRSSSFWVLLPHNLKTSRRCGGTAPPAPAFYLLILLLNTKNEGDMFLRSVGLSPNYTALQPIRLQFDYIFLFGVYSAGCETWSLTLWEEHRLRVFENRVLRRKFGPKRGEVTGEWRKLHNEELYNLSFSPNI
jgi:hypothetical protein